MHRRVYDLAKQQSAIPLNVKHTGQSTRVNYVQLHWRKAILRNHPELHFLHTIGTYHCLSDKPWQVGFGEPTGGSDIAHEISTSFKSQDNALKLGVCAWQIYTTITVQKHPGCIVRKVPISMQHLEQDCNTKSKVLTMSLQSWEHCLALQYVVSCLALLQSWRGQCLKLLVHTAADFRAGSPPIANTQVHQCLSLGQANPPLPMTGREFRAGKSNTAQKKAILWLNSSSFTVFIP